MTTLQMTLDKWTNSKASTNQSNITTSNQPTEPHSHSDETVQVIQPPTRQIKQPYLIQTCLSTTTTTIRPDRSSLNSKYDIWGHAFGPKIENSTRIVLRNISSLPKDKIHNKNDILINEIMQCQADIYCATETNIAWQNIPAEDRVYERFKGKLEFAKYTSANNKDKEFKGTFQPGGTLIITNGNICGRIQETGTENHTLQRWSWQKFRGTNNRQLVIATVYRPVFSNGPLSTYQQHKAVLLDMNIDECPRKNILTQLRIQILQWQQENYQVIILGDFNEDVSSGNIRQFFTDLHMKELIQYQHGSDAPCTMIKGSTPIDGIFGSEDINPLRSGYRSFDWGLATDHRLLWIDINTSHILGTNSTPLWKQAARRLKCSDPRIIKNEKRLFINSKDLNYYKNSKTPQHTPLLSNGDRTSNYLIE